VPDRFSERADDRERAHVGDRRKLWVVAAQEVAYEVQRNSSAASFLEASLAPASRYTSACRLCSDPLP
jgi:hypothetical protein